VKIKTTLRRGDTYTDLLLTADATATAADVARAIALSDPANEGQEPGPLTLAVREPINGAVYTLSPSTTLGNSVLLSGSVIEMVRAPEDVSGGSRGVAVAQVRVIAGPDAGREFTLTHGSSIVGRDPAAEVTLTDPMVSKRHARINITHTIEIVDIGSANGVVVSGEPVGRAQVTPSDVVILGDTSLAITMMASGEEVASSSAQVQIDHIRSPRVVTIFKGEKHQAPVPPKHLPPQRFPFLALMAPLMMGGVMWVLTKDMIGLFMMGLSPVLMVAEFIDQSSRNRRQRRIDNITFTEALLRANDRLEKSRDAERRARLAELPSTAMLETETAGRGPLLWSERPESATFLTLNAGTGRMPSRTTIEMPSNNDAFPEHWDKLLGLQQEFSTVDGVPVSLELRRDGSMGFTGPDGLRHGVARAAVFQLVARHSPAELVVAALVSPTSRHEWDWLKWLPHTSSSHSPLEGSPLADGRGAGAAVLAQLEGLIDARLKGAAPTPRGPLGDNRSPLPQPVVPSVLLVVEDSTPVDRGRLTRILERGPDAGVHVIWSAPRVESLPAACRSFIALDAGGRDGIAGQVRMGERTSPILLETLELQRAHTLARLMAPIVDVGAPIDDDSDLPRSVGYTDVAGIELLASPEAVVERWRQSNSIVVRDGSAPKPHDKEGTLRAVVGHAGAEPFVLDLRADGPHALVGGTTGAGKSEFLQAWVLGMAAAHSPDRVNFLFVDYKGGTAFADCVNLPHCVGLVTDLSPHLVRRALTSLKAELKYREHLLNEKQAKDLVTLEKKGDPDCPPSLIIIIDEFAALATEVPEFVDGVVDVAQRGRSLGLHLIMATQRPSGVIRDSLRANTNLRIALRMADDEDSMDILGDRMAARFDSSIPGRGAAKTGPGRLKPFQTGYVGGRTTGEPQAPQVSIEELDFGVNQPWEPPHSDAPGKTRTGPTDIARMVSTIGAASAHLQIPVPRKPWLDELAPVYNFAKLPNPRSDSQLLIGVLDDPDSQSQPTVHFEPDQDGNLAILGASGSGKSTALRTIAVAAATSMRNGGPTHVYGLDFGSRGLSMLEALPHVGAIVPGDDEERVIRTLRLLREMVDERSQRYSAVRAGTIGEYRALADAPDEPRVLLLVDGIGAFREQYEYGPPSLSDWFTAFAQIAADGRSVGIHVVVTGDRPNSIPNSISSTMQRIVVLRMSNEDEYVSLGVPKDMLNAASPAGRGIMGNREVQIAVLGTSGNVAVQARELEDLAGAVTRILPSPPTPIRALPHHVALTTLTGGTPGTALIGMDDRTLEPVGFEATGAFLVSGPPGSGRTTAMATIAASLARTDATMPTILLAPRKSALARAIPWAEVAQGPEAVAELARRLTPLLDKGTPRYAIFVESLTAFSDGEAEFDLDALIRAAVREDHLVVGESEISTWGQAYTLAQPFRAGRRGLLLTPDDGDLLGVSLGTLRRKDFPPGRGFLVSGGTAVKLQVADATQ